MVWVFVYLSDYRIATSIKQVCVDIAEGLISWSSSSIIDRLIMKLVLSIILLRTPDKSYIFINVQKIRLFFCYCESNVFYHARLGFLFQIYLSIYDAIQRETVDTLLTFYCVVMKKKIQYNYILELLNKLFCLILDLIEISVSTATPNLFLNDFDIKK